MWEILVPTEKRISQQAREHILSLGGSASKLYYTTRYHKLWDQKMRVITGGLTVLTSAKGAVGVAR